MSTIAVTGATGFVGQALVDELIDHGHNVLIIARDSYVEQRPEEEVVRAKLEDHPLFDAYSADALIHLAWGGAAGAARLDPAAQMQNVVMASEAVKIAHRLGAKTFVGVGTITEKEVDAVQWKEGIVPSGAYIYGVAKGTAASVTRFKAAELGLRHVWARLGNAYGIPDHSGRFLVSTVEKFVKGVETSFTSGVQMFDFVALSDAVAGLRLVTEKGEAFKEYYIGSGVPRPLREFVEISRDVIAPGRVLTFGGAAQSGVSLPPEEFSIRPLVETTGYMPQVPFRAGVEELATWVQNNL